MTEEVSMRPLIKLLMQHKVRVPYQALQALFNHYAEAVTAGRPFTINDIEEFLHPTKRTNQHIRR